MSSIKRLVFIALVGIVPVSPSFSQGLTGQISGSIAEQSGSVVVGATIELLNQGTSQTRSTVTDTLGEYIFPQLLAGQYTLTRQRSGI